MRWTVITIHFSWCAFAFLWFFGWWFSRWLIWCDSYWSRAVFLFLWFWSLTFLNYYFLFWILSLGFGLDLFWLWKTKLWWLNKSRTLSISAWFSEYRNRGLNIIIKRSKWWNLLTIMIFWNPFILNWSRPFLLKNLTFQIFQTSADSLMRFSDQLLSFITLFL